MSITASKYINNSELKTSYIGLYQYARPTRTKGDLEVNIYGLLSVSSVVEIPGDRIAKFAWDGIVDGFEYSKTDSVNESLKLSLSEATRRIKQLIANDKGISENGIDINFTVFVSNNGGIYIGLLGDADIFVYKRGRLVDVFEMLNKKRAKTAGIAIDEGDLVFSSTKNFLKENLKKIIGTKNREELITTLEELGREVGDDQGFVLLSKEKDVQVQKKALVQEKIKSSEITENEKSDYIPLSKPPAPLLKSPIEEKDLTAFVLEFKKKVGIVGGYLKKISIPFNKLSFKSFPKVSNFFKKIFSKIKEKLLSLFGRKRWFKKMSSTVSQSSVVRNKREKFKGFKIDGYKDKNLRFKRFKTLAFVVIGITLILAGVKFTINQKEARERSKTANEIFTEVESLLESANSKLSTDRDSSILNIYKAAEQLDKVPQELSETDKLKFEELESKVLGIEDAVYKRVRLSLGGSLEKYVDMFTTHGAESKPTDISIHRDGNANEYLFLTDIGIKSVYRISLYNKEVKQLSDDEGLLQKPSFVYSKGSGIYVYDLVNGVIKAPSDGNWYKSFVKPTGLGLQNIKAGDVAEFAVFTTNDNVYVLDRESRALLRLTNYGTGYGLSEEYLKSDSYEFANDVFADMSVYVLVKGESGILRYVSNYSIGRLVESSITLKGLDKPLKNAQFGYTADDLYKDLFVYDSEDKRILRFEKPIESGDIRHPNELLLIKQYVLPSEEGWNDVKDFVVDFNQKNLYILNGTTIWKVTL
ncbi:MAG: hypothetical protein UR61_C0009G0011 [candidate division WS6 bacterium GW2011_GWE1_34_7]|uniref:Uncharacterized protein n=1 Tax=candidate division WS6 bacterium GW2011_GWE1_34_7 TaxID=1619093 RepID=A0A0G0B937_9BACT|nr:MAG: hypothetical protein UR61_C0009G0011 [candidate division WS6 bacterium GW2011_GWE1_34_7]